MAAKSKLKVNEATKSAYVNEFLCKDTLKLFNYVKSLINFGYNSIYTHKSMEKFIR